MPFFHPFLQHIQNQNMKSTMERNKICFSSDCSNPVDSLKYVAFRLEEDINQRSGSLYIDEENAVLKQSTFKLHALKIGLQTMN